MLRTVKTEQKAFMNAFLMNDSFKIFGIEIYYYALCVVGGMLISALVAIPLVKRRGLSAEILIDVLIALIPLAIIGARVWYVVCDLDEFFRDGEILYTTTDYGWKIPRFLDLRGGGLAIHGGIVGGAIAIFIVALIKKVPAGKIFDFAAPVLPLGQAIGRWGNFFNQEVYGKVVLDPNLQFFPYAVYIEESGDWHLALFFYEMVLNLIVFALLYTFMMKYKGKRNWYAFGLYLIFYGIIRAIMEPLRDTEFNMGNAFGGLPMMSWVSMLIALGGLALFSTMLILDIRDKNYWWKDLFKKKEVKEE